MYANRLPVRLDRYKAEFLEAQEAEALQGRIVLGPGVFSKIDGQTLSQEGSGTR